MPHGAGSAALAGRLRLPRLRPSRALRAGGPGALPVQPLQEPGIAHGGHDLPCDQAAAEALVRGHPPDRDGEERRLFGGTRPPPRGQAADGLGHEAQDHGGDGTYNHRSVRTGSGPKAARVASFKWVNTTLGNIKSAITGTYRKLGPDHAERYLASFAWRYNRRYHLKTMITRFVHSAARTNPMPYRILIAG